MLPFFFRYEGILCGYAINLCPGMSSAQVFCSLWLQNGNSKWAQALLLFPAVP